MKGVNFWAPYENMQFMDEIDVKRVASKSEATK